MIGNTLEINEKSEIVFKCLSVITNDLNMIKITIGLSKMIAQLSGTTKLWKKWPKDMWKYFARYNQISEIILNAFLQRNTSP